MVATEIFLDDPSALDAELGRLHRSLHADEGDGGDSGLGDFADHLLPALVERGRVYADPLPGYWKDLGRPQAYLQAHRDLLAGRVDVFDRPGLPVRSGGVDGPPAWFGPEAEVSEAMAGPGSRVRGRVVRSVLGPRVEVQSGAVVEDSVLLGDTLVEAEAVVRTSVLDTGVVVGRGARVGATPSGTRLTDEVITLVGKDCRIGRGSTVAAGARLDPGATA